MILQGKAKYPVREAIIHTAATPGSWADGKSVNEMVAEIDRWHKDRGWKGIGYHRVIAPDGSIGVGRSLYEIGAHVKERNRGTIGICLIPAKGAINRATTMGRFDDWYTPAQKAALQSYLSELAELMELKWVTGHNAYAPKLCPGFWVEKEPWLAAANFRPVAAPPADHVPAAPPKQPSGFWASLVAALAGIFGKDKA